MVDWYPLGVQLDVPTSEMRQFEIIHRGNPTRCMLDMLEYWMLNSENVSWRYLANALETVGGYAKVVHSLLRREEEKESALKQSGDGMCSLCVCCICHKCLATVLIYRLCYLADVPDSPTINTVSAVLQAAAGSEVADDTITRGQEPTSNGSLSTAYNQPSEAGTSTATRPSMYDQALAESDLLRGALEPTEQLDPDSLAVETQKIQVTFNVLFSRVCEVMEKRGVSVESLVFFLEGQPALEQISPGGPSPSILDAEMPALRKKKSLKEVFGVLRNYCSFFNHILLNGIIKRFCNGDAAIEQDQVTLKAQLVCYYKQRVCNCPHEKLFGIKKESGQAAVRMKIDRQWASVCVGQLAYLRDSIAHTLNLKRYTLLLCAAERGCFELTVVVPNFIIESIFLTLSPEQEGTLQGLGVTMMSCEWSSVISSGSSVSVSQSRALLTCMFSNHMHLCNEVFACTMILIVSFCYNCTRNP